MRVLRSNRGSWPRPRNLHRVDVEAGQFVGFDGRVQRIYGDDQRALLDGEERVAGGEVVRVDREPGETAAQRGGF